MNIGSRSSSIAPIAQSRKRSSTASSLSSLLRPSQQVFHPAPPLKVGDSVVLTGSVDNNKNSHSVILAAEHWPGVAAGDLILVAVDVPDPDTAYENGFLFIFRPHPQEKHSAQIQFHPSVADVFGFRGNKSLRLTKVEQRLHAADFVEISFQDQYLGRSDMWRLGNALAGQCVHIDQKITFVGHVDATVKIIYSDQKKIASCYMAPHTKIIFRSLSARVTLFIQVCHELWEFADDGERHYEKLVHSFLPALFDRWHGSTISSLVSIILVSRVYYDQEHLKLADGPLRSDDEGNHYKDFFKVIMDLEIVAGNDWRNTLVNIKECLWSFQRDILLTHHYHRAKALAESQVRPLDSGEFTDGPNQVQLLGRISFAHDGPILEALNLALNPTETHYIDRSLSLTGSSAILVTPGTGFFKVSKHLLRLTTSRMLDQGFSLDIVCLTKPPLHRSPIFAYRGSDPDLRQDRKSHTRESDPLWGGDISLETSAREKNSFYWEPFWASTTFWDRQMDLPMREDRFVARCKMHDIQMMALLEHDLLTAIVIPFLEESMRPASKSYGEGDIHARYSAEKDAGSCDQYDADVFTLKATVTSSTQRASVTSSGGSTVMSSSVKTLRERNRIRTLTRASDDQSRNVSPLDTPVSGSPQDHAPVIGRETQRRSQPSRSHTQDNFHPIVAAPPEPTVAVGPMPETTTLERPIETLSTRREAGIHSSFATKAQSWLFGALRPSAPALALPPAPRPRSPISRSDPMPVPAPPKSITIKASSSRPTPLMSDEDTLQLPPTARRQPHRSSPISTSPRDLAGSLGARYERAMTSTSSPGSVHPVPTNPSRLQTQVPPTEASLAKRWQHIFPRPFSQHSMKWKSLTAPACLPLTVEYFPSPAELDSQFKLQEYSFVTPTDMRSFLFTAPQPSSRGGEESRDAWALAVMKGMAAQRLAQGFQFVVSSQHEAVDSSLEKRQSLHGRNLPATPKPLGAADVLKSAAVPVFLSMSNEIHCISFNGDLIQVKRYLRRMGTTPQFDYQCLVWPKLGDGYTTVETAFSFPNLETYGWNRLDMVVAGYEQSLNESLRYWRTRFIVIPADTPQSEDGLSEEEVRLKGADKLAELFTKARWLPSDQSNGVLAPLRFVATTLSPSACVLDDTITGKLDEIHETGPLQKKPRSERVFAQHSLIAVAAAMRDTDGVYIKAWTWRDRTYPEAFTGSDLVSWLVREFKDISTREQGVQAGSQLMNAGLFLHCRGKHPFMDGTYFYRLAGEYAAPGAAKPRWFVGRRLIPVERKNGGDLPPQDSTLTINTSRKRLVLSQTHVIDVDPQKRSDESQYAILHSDVIHNPQNGFHFELNWLGTTARCIQDLLKMWNRAVEKYGLKIIEAYVDQITDVKKKNVFQSCLPIRLARLPPAVGQRYLIDGSCAHCMFECAILRKFDFVLDIEAGAHYSEQVDVYYSYRRSAFRWTQMVHKTGVAFVQVLGGSEGFRWLKNRLLDTDQVGLMTTEETTSSFIADELRQRLTDFCSDPDALEAFYNQTLNSLPTTPTEMTWVDDTPPASGQS